MLVRLTTGPTLTALDEGILPSARRNEEYPISHFLETRHCARGSATADIAEAMVKLDEELVYLEIGIQKVVNDVVLRAFDIDLQKIDPMMAEHSGQGGKSADRARYGR